MLRWIFKKTWFDATDRLAATVGINASILTAAVAAMWVYFVVGARLEAFLTWWFVLSVWAATFFPAVSKWATPGRQRSLDENPRKLAVRRFVLTPLAMALWISATYLSMRFYAIFAGQGQAGAVLQGLLVAVAIVMLVAGQLFWPIWNRRDFRFAQAVGRTARLALASAWTLLVAFVVSVAVLGVSILTGFLFPGPAFVLFLQENMLNLAIKRIEFYKDNPNGKFDAREASEELWPGLQNRTFKSQVLPGK